MNCPNCNYTVPAGNDSCPVCGCRLPEEKKGGSTMSADKLILLIVGIVLACVLLVLIPIGLSSGSNRGGLFLQGDQVSLPTMPPAPERTDEAPVRIGTFASDEEYFYCDTDHVVTFTLTEGVGLVAPQVVWDNEVVGIMNDNGVDGDETADDGIFSLSVPFNVPATEAATHDVFAVMGGEQSNPVTLVDCTDSDIEQADGYFDEIDAHIRELETGFNREGTDQEKLDSALETYNNIKGYLEGELAAGRIEELDVDGLSFRVLLRGGTYVYEFNPEDYWAGIFGRLFFTTETTTAPGGEELQHLILSAQPFLSESSMSTVDASAQRIAAADDNYVFANNADDAQVSVELLADLTPYKTIIWVGHGGYDNTNHSFICTGTPWAMLDTDYFADRVGIHAGIINKGGRCSVTSSFFYKYYADKKMDHAMIYLGCCQGMNDTELAEALVYSGFDTVLGYHNSVPKTYEAEMCQSLFNAMIEQNSDGLGSVPAVDALNRAKEDNGQTSDDGWMNDLIIRITGSEDTRAELMLYGNPQYRLFTHNGVLSGQVCGASDLTGILGAQVEARNAENNAIASTNASGNYTVELPAGDYTVTISAPGYITFNCYTNVASDTVTYMETFLLVEGEEGAQGEASGRVVNSLTGNGEDGVTLRFVKDWNSIRDDEPIGEVITTVTTDSAGNYSVELPLGNYTAIASKDGFITDHFNIVVQTSPTPNQDGTITPLIEGSSYLITLTWGENPEDMDSHMVGTHPNGSTFHVYYSHKRTTYNDTDVCTLDYDDTTSYGPEHITLEAISEKPYYFYVYKYYGSGTTASSGATVTVHRGNVLIATYHVPTDLGSGRYWNVFAIVNGRLITRNTITDSAETSYAD